MLKSARSFFEVRDVVEVDCPALVNFAPIDLNIEVIEAEGKYLFTSPEYGMKRLLADGSGDIYQLGHVFRKGESTSRHNPEFTMIEWYRIGFSKENFYKECFQLVELFIGQQEKEIISYRNAFLKHASIDPFLASDEELLEKARELKLGPQADSSWIRDDLLDLFISLYIERKFDPKKITILEEYPASQAALARTKMVEGIEVAERFEIFAAGMELGNGYHELTCAKEQKARFEKTNQKRQKTLPIDKHLLKALEKGLPDCYGMAIGFDRLMMIASNKENISDVLTFPFDDA